MIKTARKIGVTGGILTAAKNAEASLAREEAKGIEEGLPPGHPLRNEAEKQKALLGDLSGLPPGHPLLRAMQAAKERYDQQQGQKQEEQNNTSEANKARKIEDERTRQEARRAEDTKIERLNESAGMVNKGLDGALASIRGLYKTLADNEEILNIDPLSRAKVVRLRRLLFAAERGLSDGKIAKARV